jgi:5-methylcytosine-specific restriction endonuclease McrA
MPSKVDSRSKDPNNPRRKHSAAYQKAAKVFKEQCKAQGVVVCYFCGEYINMDLHHYDKWSFTVQHIVPVSRGGGVADIENMAPAHRRCNAQEGNRLAGTVDSDGDMTMGPQLKRSRIW